MHPPNFFDSLFNVADDVLSVATPIAALFGGDNDDSGHSAPVVPVAAPMQVAARQSNDGVLIVAAFALLLLFK